MNAVLKPVESRCIERPKYDNSRLDRFASWLTANHDALRDYYRALGKTLPGNEDGNLMGQARAQAFMAFAQVQWDQERGLF